MTRTSFVIVLALATACASLPAKQRAVVGLQASETALEAAHDAERALCAPTADQTKAITHCDGPQAASLRLTDARHHDLADLFSRAFAAEQVAAKALLAWKAGDPVPTDIAGYQAIVNEIVQTVVTLLPQATAVISHAKVAQADVMTVVNTGGK